MYLIQSASEGLIKPVLTVCNPGRRIGVSQGTGNPRLMDRQWRNIFKNRVDQTFYRMLAQSTRSQASPVMEEIQQVTSAGEIPYALDVKLKSDAAGGRIVMHNSVATGPDEERTRLFRAVKFDRPLGESDFIDETQPFYAFGKAQKPECRLFVRVIDHTGPNQKEIFKSLLATVERHFYKKLMPNSSGESALLSQPANTASSFSDNQARFRRPIAPLSTDYVN